jgi:hypothetical protein
VRFFLVTALLLSAQIFALGALSGCATYEKKPVETSIADEPVGIPIIDAHLHARFTGKPNKYSGIIVSDDSLTKEMKESGVVAALSISPNYEEGVTPSQMPLVRCAGIGDKIVEAARLEKLLKSKQATCIKIYLGYVPQYANDPHYHVAYRLARKYKVPVVFHTGDTSTDDALLKYADPLQIDEIAVQYRDVKFVIAHLGNPWVESAAEVVYKNDNVYADVSAFLVGKPDTSDTEKWNEFVIKPIHWAYGYIENPKKLMYGTDWPLQAMKPYIWAVKQAIPKDHWKDVFYNNAIEVYGFPLKPIP